ncbi:hypothetical protein CI109_106301 [Kwoniella shandongensis]|uniref:Alpha-mannosidase n=1 Tax=Kwoniella shandongensis TaxID=1734106 RepID=A0A5M6BTM5_9TREE|nr:uncharacterized protein CI109_006745 [Kwoniella shandongensis]KAA5524945.1 hypothetical protein CI109_006745 [Kwoniella shandongensis]
METIRANYPVINLSASYKPLSDIAERLRRFTGGSSRHTTLTGAISKHRLDDTKHVSISVWSAPGRSKPTFEEAIKQDFRPTKKGESFGPAWTNHWFKVELHIPSDWQQYERVQLEFDCSGEGMVFDSSGQIQHGLTGGYGRDRRVEFIIPSDVVKSGTAVYHIEGSCNAMFGQATLENPDPNNVGQDILDTAADDERYYRLNCADLVAVDMVAQKLYWDVIALQQLSTSLPPGSAFGSRAQWTVNKIINAFQPEDEDSFKVCRRLAENLLGKDWEAKVDKDSLRPREEGQVWAIGHCHIDTAWLWPIEVTQQKSARSWSTQCDLMDRYPEHRFAATQAQQYKWVEQLYPQLFSRIKERVSTGHFQPVGCTWVEMDVNMPSGEALCRQFLYGQRYFESRFGIRSNTCVLPDTFGYCAQLPQIIRLADAQDFFTIKLSWNTFNKFPHSTFNWVGLDGTQVLAHLSPTDSYSSQGDIEEICQAVTAHKNLEVTDQSVFLFGNGDGGGGPTPVMLEKLRRARAIAQLPLAGGQVPKVRMGGTFGQFFDSVRGETNNGLDLPIWRGEMYFECHRGTYTTHAAIKRGNRKNEILARQAEYAATVASLVNEAYQYPFERLDASWEDLLLCQFHDVLPGSGIAMIYDDAKRKYANMEKVLSSILHESYDCLFGSPPPGALGDAGSIVAVNTLPSRARREVVLVKDSPNGVVPQASCQTSLDKSSTLVLFDVNKDSPLARPIVLPSTTSSVSVDQTSSTRFVLANGTIKVTLDKGRIVSLFDIKARKELVPDGSSGGLVIMEDVPNNYDAWDIDSFHLQKQRHLLFEDITVVESGPLRGTLGAKVSLNGSRIDVKISLDAVGASQNMDSRSLIRFDMVADWHASHEILKFELPTTILSDEATYDAQFGFVKRPTHRNTSHDAAKFEVCAHTFADLSEYGYGVAIINDCKYGHAVCGNVMTLSLLRAPKSPDPDADMGVHECSWAIYPHLKTFVESDVAQVATAFNVPMIAYSLGAVEDAALKFNPFAVIGAPNVVLDTVKRGEADRQGDGRTKTVVLRLFERLGGHAQPTLRVRGMRVRQAAVTNILEDKGVPLGIESGDVEGVVCLSFDMRGFEIKTIKLYIES